MEEAQLDLGLALTVTVELDRLSDVYPTTARGVLLLHVSEILAQLKGEGIRNGVLTGNSELRSRRKLEGGGVNTTLIDWSVGFFGVRSPVRSALTASSRKAHPETSLLIISDTPFDGIAAKAANIPFLAVCTGKYDRAAFEDSEAIAVIDTLAEGYETIMAA